MGIVDNVQKDIDEYLQKKTRKKGINSYRKGSSFERLISKQLSSLLGIEIARVPMSGAFGTTHNSDLVSGDLFCPKKNEFFPFTIECKHQKQHDVILNTLNTSIKNNILLKWTGQSLRDAVRCFKVPLTIFRLNRSQIFLCTPYTYVYKTKTIKFSDYLKDRNLIVLFFYKNKCQLATPLDNFNLDVLYNELKKD